AAGPCCRLRSTSPPHAFRRCRRRAHASGRRARRGFPPGVPNGRACGRRSPGRRPRSADVTVRRPCLRPRGRVRPGSDDRTADDGRGAGGGRRRCVRGQVARRAGPRRLRRGVARFITFLTDFGLRDDFVGTCHGVIKRIAPDVEIIDITHGLEPGRVLQGALVLANALPYMPVGVHLAVVDPGVGGSRRALALRDADGRLYVGPDNGLLVPAAERLGGIAEAYELANPAYALESVSRTFHGRDLFSPAAAHLALGVDPAELGPPIDPGALAHIDLPQPDVGANRIRATILYVDRFGNVQLNLTRAHLA